MDPDVEYRVMLSNLDSILRDDDMIRLRSFCKDYIPARKRDSLNQGVELFEALEERNKLSQDNLSFLKEALGSCCAGRSDVIDLVKTYEEKHSSFLGNDERKSEIRSISDFLQNSLGREYKSFLRLLGTSDDFIDRLKEDHRKVSEVIYRCMIAWQKNDIQVSKETIIKALRTKSVGRNDLANRIENGDFIES